MRERHARREVRVVKYRFAERRDEENPSVVEEVRVLGGPLIGGYASILTVDESKACTESPDESGERARGEQVGELSKNQKTGGGAKAWIESFYRG